MKLNKCKPKKERIEKSKKENNKFCKKWKMKNKREKIEK